MRLVLDGLKNYLVKFRNIFILEFKLKQARILAYNYVLEKSMFALEVKGLGRVFFRNHQDIITGINNETV